MKWKSWNDQLGILIILLICALIGWNFWATGVMPVETLLVLLTLVIQFYFRRKDDSGIGKQ